MTRTRQEIFDLAWNGLKAQGFRASTSDYAGGCAYRSGDGERRCAIGHCIPDDRYTHDLEGRCADSAEVQAAASLAEEDWRFVSELQCCHDNAEGRKDMERRLRAFADFHSLTIPS